MPESLLATFPISKEDFEQKMKNKPLSPEAIGIKICFNHVREGNLSLDVLETATVEIIEILTTSIEYWKLLMREATDARSRENN